MSKLQERKRLSGLSGAWVSHRFVTGMHKHSRRRKSAILRSYDTSRGNVRFLHLLFYIFYFSLFWESYGKHLVAMSCAARERDARTDDSRDIVRGARMHKKSQPPRTNCASPPQTLHEIDNSRVVAQNPLCRHLRLQHIDITRTPYTLFLPTIRYSPTLASKGRDALLYTFFLLRTR